MVILPGEDLECDEPEVAGFNKIWNERETVDQSSRLAPQFVDRQPSQITSPI